MYNDKTKHLYRPPIVTFMGHIDHGKTSIQDFIRKTNIVMREDGKITQHIGASVVEYKDKKIVFIDTPGHEAFAMMRLRGAKVTDIVVLVIAAGDGVKPQTIEAISHARSANVPIIVAINKVDLPTSDPDRIILQMQENGLISEELDGNIGTIRVSAMTGFGINDLLDRIILEAEILELKLNVNNIASCVVLESKNDSDFGPIANIIVRDGVLKLGDFVICEQYYGKVKLLIDEFNHHIDSVSSGYPVKLIGLDGVVNSGSIIEIVKDEKKILKIIKDRKEEIKLSNLKEIHKDAKEILLDIKDVPKINIIIKSDVQGTLEVIVNFINEIITSVDNLDINLVYSSVGQINVSDVLLAATSNSLIIGFKVKVNSKILQMAKNNNVDIKIYSIIYDLMDETKDFLKGKIIPDKLEEHKGTAKILKIFNVSKNKKVYGCVLEEGNIKSNMNVKIYRGDRMMFDGSTQSLKRYQKDVDEVKNNDEFGISFVGFNNANENDNIKFYNITFSSKNEKL